MRMPQAPVGDARVVRHIAIVVKPQLHLAMRWPTPNEIRVVVARGRGCKRRAVTRLLTLKLALGLLMSHARAFERFERKSLAILLLKSFALGSFDPGLFGPANLALARALGVLPRFHLFEIRFVAPVWHVPFLLEALVVALALARVWNFPFASAPFLRPSSAAVFDARVPRVGRCMLGSYGG